MEVKLSALLGHFDIPTNQPSTDRQTDRAGHREVSLPISNSFEWCVCSTSRIPIFGEGFFCLDFFEKMKVYQFQNWHVFSLMSCLKQLLDRVEHTNWKVIFVTQKLPNQIESNPKVVVFYVLFKTTTCFLCLPSGWSLLNRKISPRIFVIGIRYEYQKCTLSLSDHLYLHFSNFRFRKTRI